LKSLVPARVTIAGVIGIPIVAVESLCKTSTLGKFREPIARASDHVSNGNLACLLRFFACGYREQRDEFNPQGWRGGCVPTETYGRP
jgi:hypothetical protein